MVSALNQLLRRLHKVIKVMLILVGLAFNQRCRQVMLGLELIKICPFDDTRTIYHLPDRTACLTYIEDHFLCRIHDLIAGDDTVINSSITFRTTSMS